ncbi:DNA translocase FtsK [Mycoplasmatota bacterium]|nr:DNA translocase FtsK [Mycoplasmatota bacterium]
MSKDKKRKVVDDNNKEGLVYFEIWGILFILFSLILISELGPVGKTLNTLVKMIFGDWYWLILIFMFYYGTMMIIYHEFITYSSIKIKGFIFISAGLLIYSHFPIYNALESQIKSNHSNIVTESYNLFLGYIDRQSSNATFGGGLLGAFLFWTSYVLLGSIGTKIIAIILLISGVAYLFEKTIYDFIDDIYFGIIKLYQKSKKIVKNTFDKMYEVSKYNKTQNKEVVIDKVQLKSPSNQKFDNITLTKNEKIEVKHKKYNKPNLKMLKYHDNKEILENQKEITLQNAKIINDFLKAFNLNLTIDEVYIGPTISTYIIEVENSIKSKKILNYKNDLFVRLDTDNIRMYEKYENKQSLIIEVPNEYRYLVSLREILEEDEDKQMIPIGRNYCGKLHCINFNKMPNILVIGNDINSKIDLLKTIINVIVYKYRPDEFQLILCDSTKFELNSFEYIPHLFYPFIHDFQSMKPMLIKIYTEVEQRLTKLNENKKSFKPILLVLNDFVDFYMNNNDYLKYLNYILVYGGKVSIYTIFSTNNMDEKILTNNLRAQFDGIISFMINNKEISFKYLEDDTTKLLKNGDCIIYSRSDNLSTRVQVVNLTNLDEY